MHLQTSVKLTAFLIASGGGVAFAASAALTSAYPPPGLYRVDTQGSTQVNRGALPAITQQYAQEGVGGSVQLKGGKAGEAPVTASYAGQGPANICIKPLPASGAMPVATSCKSSAPDVTPGSLRYVSVCSGMKLDTTIRKVNATTWEFRSVILYSGAPMAGQKDFSGMRRMLAAQVKTGATAQERSDAAAALAQMGVYEAEMKKNAAALKGAQAEAAAEQGGASAAAKYTKQQTVIKRLTRLAYICPTTAAR